VRRGWEDIAARVHGLTTHLLGRAKLAALARARDLPQLARAFAEDRSEVLLEEVRAEPELLELAERRAAAAYLRIIARWSGDRAPLLAPIFLDEDRRSVRAMLRGTAAGTPEGERMAGLVATPALPERALQELARQASVGQVAALLSVWGHPFGQALLPESRAPHPDLLRLELAMNRCYAATALRAVHRAPRADGARRDLEAFVRRGIDVENTWSVVQLAAEPTSVDPASFFIPGGWGLDQASFIAAARSPDVPAAEAVLERSFRGGALSVVLRGARRSSWEEAALSALLRESIAAARRSPLGVAPLVAFLVRLRAELRDLRLIVWRVALGAPAAGPGDLLTTI
jgi:vacuolar-type H+-ATPase subunit C/Vma6